MRLSWSIWVLVSVLLGLYFFVGYLSSRAGVIDLKLERGTTAEIEFLRLAEGRLRMTLEFRGDNRRSELGVWESSSDWMRTGFLTFPNPGAAVRLDAASPNGAPVMYETMPAAAFGANVVSRNLTSDLSIRPGVWRWPPQNKDVLLEFGYNTIRIEVISIDAPLSGETVQLILDPPLGFKAADPKVAWLWYWFFWPYLVLALIVWACLLGIIQAQRGRTPASSDDVS